MDRSMTDGPFVGNNMIIQLAGKHVSSLHSWIHSRYYLPASDRYVLNVGPRNVCNQYKETRCMPAQ